MFFAAGRGNWSAEGCTAVDINQETGLITCNCTHLTNFALLVVSLHTSFPESHFSLLSQQQLLWDAGF